jgi:hypothetical protein
MSLGIAAIVPVGFCVSDRATLLPAKLLADQTGCLVLLDVRAHRRAGFVVVEGAVRNVSGRPCERMEVVADLLVPAGFALDQGSGLVEPTLLMPGRSAAFRVILDDDERAGAVGLSFRRLRLSPLTPPIEPTIRSKAGG